VGEPVHERAVWYRRNIDKKIGDSINLVHEVLVSPLACGSVHPVSSPSTGSAP